MSPIGELGAGNITLTYWENTRGRAPSVVCAYGLHGKSLFTASKVCLANKADPNVCLQLIPNSVIIYLSY